MCSKMLYSDEQEKHATQPVHNKTNHCSPAGASPHVCTPHDAPALVAEEEQAPEEQAPPLQLSVQATANLSAKHSLVKGRDPVTDTQSQPGCVEHCQNNHVKLHDGADNLHCSNPFAEEFQQHMLAHLQPHYTQVCVCVCTCMSVYATNLCMHRSTTLLHPHLLYTHNNTVAGCCAMHRGAPASSTRSN